MKLKKIVFVVLISQVVSSVVFIPSFFSAVTPGQEQERFKSEFEGKEADYQSTEKPQESVVEFAESEPGYSEDEDQPRPVPSDQGGGKRSVSYASDQFDRPLPPAGYNAAEQKDLKAAERQASEDAAAIAAGAAPLREEVPFFVEKINVTGNTIFKNEELHSIVAPYEGKELKLTQVKEAAGKITQAYRAKGYITCRAYIPPQKIETKVLEIKVLEGKLGKVKVRGNKFFKKSVIKRYVEQMRGQPLKFDDLKSSLTKLNMHPDREVKAVIVPGQQVGTSDLLLDVKDSRPIHIGGEINNFGTELTGKERYNVTARHTNLLGVDDIFAARVQFGEEVFAVGAQHVLPVGPYGSETGWTFNYTDVKVGGAFSVLDIGGQAYTGSVFFNHPLYDSERFDLTWTSSFESKSIYNEVLGRPSSEDQLRIIHTGANVDLIDRWGRTFITNDLSFAGTWLGANDRNDPLNSRAGAGSPFLKYKGVLNRIHPVYDQTYLFMKGTVQQSNGKLVSAEQYDMGGVYSVRGYPQSDYLGDSGVTGSLELRVPWYFLPREYKVPQSDQPLWDKIHFVGFIDGGYAKLRSPVVGEDASKTSIGAGGGVRFDLPNNLNARFEWASPLGDDPTDHSNGQFYFTVSGEFF